MEGPVGLAPTPPRFTVSGCCLTLRSHCRRRNRTFTCQFQRLVDYCYPTRQKWSHSSGSAPRRLLYERSSAVEEPTSGNAPDCSVHKTEVARFAYRQNGPYGTSCTLTGPRSKRGASAIGLRRDGVA